DRELVYLAGQPMQVVAHNFATGHDSLLVNNDLLFPGISADEFRELVIIDFLGRYQDGMLIDDLPKGTSAVQCLVLVTKHQYRGWNGRFYIIAQQFGTRFLVEIRNILRLFYN